MKSQKYSKIPTQEDLQNFSGMHCARLYRGAVESRWKCPSSGRTAQQLVRWTEIKGPSFRARFGDEHGMGFSVSLTRHHCHGHGRFLETLICGDCNSADGAAKRKLKLPKDWSFSAEEIRQFVSVKPYSGATYIDYETAMSIYRLNS
ncbi:hypothetical protein GRI43_11960 [Altererythrobacter luteolus]|uniref:Recombination endonuclease VII n=1 Tax=Pontixanthobacter luteolus TaxID=295089 RepID=A0A6I4V409_9SPHN|nr:hypothetical protein [Pontixanthobacter luteolus]MXP48101.1 hypothetical protein [Pontixanthobacter luteolus]